MWRAYLGLIRKEFIQIRRDKAMLRIVFLMPIVQLLLLGYAVNTDVKLLKTDVYDYDRSSHSREFIRSFDAGDYFVPDERLVSDETTPLWEMEDRFRKNETQMAIVIPEDFSEKLTLGDNIRIGMIADGSDANAARSGLGYAGLITRQYSQRVTGMELPLEIRHTFRYNPELESVYFMVPGIVATLLTMVTISLTAMGIVREREMGTLEQISVTPIAGYVLLLGKITTFALLGLAEMMIALAVGILWFGIPFAGSPLFLALMSGLYLLTTLGLGTFFSTVTSTQQQAMFLAWFFSIFAILTSGFFSPISNMPGWMQRITMINPMRFFMEVVRGIMMKGSGPADLVPEIIAIAIYGLVIFSLAAARFRKRSA
ncbi:MAG: ABC transporter permease [Candidatus Zixiibacteriota bacterium]